MQRQVRVHFIDAPMNNHLRPTTDDTVHAWLQSAPVVGNYLAVSNSPYINRQDIVIRALAPQGYGFDTIGPSVYAAVKMAIVLDELARSIFMLSRHKKLQNSQ